MKNAQKPRSDTFVISFGSCSFKRIYNDASKLLEISQASGLKEYVYISCLPRTAILLFAVSMEALANRVVRDIEELHHPHEIDEKATTAEKWKLLPKYHPHSKRRGFNTTSKKWQSFVELIKWRNDYVHPKAVMLDVQRGKKTKEGLWTGASVVRSSEIPKHIRKSIPDLAAPRSHGVSGLPTSPYDVVFADAEKARRIVDQMIDSLDEKLSGRLTSARLLEEHDQAIAVYPDGVTERIGILRGMDGPLRSSAEG